MQRRWRWTTARAETFVNSAGRDLTLTIAGESPLRYFDTAPHVTIRAGNQVLATAEPSSDFELDVKVPAAALAASDGMLTIETDQSFVPNERSGSPDRPHARAADLRDDDAVAEVHRDAQPGSRRHVGLRILQDLVLLKAFSPGTAASCRSGMLMPAATSLDSSPSAPDNSALTGAGGT